MGFLADVASHDGHNALVGILPAGEPSDGRARIVHHWLSFNNVATVRTKIVEIEESGYDVYYALSAYAGNESKLDRYGGRTQANVVSIKSFWLDIDAGPVKWNKADSKRREGIYKTLEQAIEALTSATNATGLPEPTHIVASGGGLHVYWALQSPIPPTRWLPTARNLQKCLSSAGLRIDTSRTTDVASVLRPPGCINSNVSISLGKESRVELLKSSAPITVEALEAALLVACADLVEKPTRPRLSVVPTSPPPATYTAASGRVTPEMVVASNAIARRLPVENDENIKKLGRALKSLPSSCSREEWRRVIWGIQALKWASGFEIARWWSGLAGDEYPNWERDLVKLWDTNREKPNGIGVGSLIHAIESAGVEAPQFDEISTHAKKVLHVENTVDGLGTVKYAFPRMPQGFTRHKAEPGLWRYVADEDGEDDSMIEIKFYDHDLFILDRVRTGTRYELVIAHYLPRDGYHRIHASYAAITNPTDLRKEIAKFNIIPNGATGWSHMSRYLSDQARMLTEQRAAVHRVDSMGWQADGTFVHGNQKYQPDGSTQPIVPSSNIETLADAVGVAGTLEAWKKMASLFAHKGFEAAHLAMFLSMGTPLYRYAGVTGGVVNFYTEQTAAGKTTAVRAAATVWGNPGSGADQTDFFLSGNATDLSLPAQMARAGSLPAFVDEITKDNDQKRILGLREFIRHSTSGRERARQKSGTSEFRETRATWQNFLITTANRSLESTLSSGSLDAERARTLDVPYSVPRLKDVGYAFDDYFHLLRGGMAENYGHAGRELVQYYMHHEGEIREAVLSQIKWFNENGAQDRDRFIVSILSVALVAGRVANELGLVNYPLAPVTDFACTLIGRQHEASAESTPTAATILDEFLRRHNDKILFTKKIGAKHLMLGNRTPLTPCAGRWATDEERLYVVAQSMREFCVDLRVDLGTVERYWEQRGIVVVPKDARRGRYLQQIRLGKGLKDAGFDPGRAWVYEIDSTKAGLSTEDMFTDGDDV